MSEAPPERFASPPQSWARSPFPPIADYAFLSDCEAMCLVAPNGAVEWMCLPRPDSPSVFTTMLIAAPVRSGWARTTRWCRRPAATCPAA